MSQENNQEQEKSEERPNMWGLLILLILIGAAIICRYLVTGQWIHPHAGM